MTRKGNSLVNSVVTAGLLTGTLDIAAAILQYYVRTGKGPANVFRFIASGVFGTKAFAGGLAMAGWGLLFHYGIAFLFTICFFLLYPKIAALQINWAVTGIIYGLLVWAVMNLLVLPASSAPPIPFHAGRALLAAGILILCVGLPLSLLANKYYLYKK